MKRGKVVRAVTRTGDFPPSLGGGDDGGAGALVTTAAGDVTKADTLKQALAGCGAVLFCASASKVRDETRATCRYASCAAPCVIDCFSSFFCYCFLVRFVPYFLFRGGRGMYAFVLRRLHDTLSLVQSGSEVTFFTRGALNTQSGQRCWMDQKKISAFPSWCCQARARA